MISEFWQGFLIGGLVGSPTLIAFCWLCGKFNIWLYGDKNGKKGKIYNDRISKIERRK